MSNVDPNELSNRGASFTGFHFTNLYQNCQMKFHFRFVLRLAPEGTPYALIQGSAFHEGKEEFYKTADADKAMDRMNEVIEERAPELENAELADRLRFRAPAMLESWISERGWKDLQEYDFVAIEQQAVMPIPGTDYVFSAKPDAIVRHRQTGKLIVLESKTSGFSASVTDQGVRNGDQATSYYWACKHITGEYPFGVQPDITYWSNRSSNVDLIKNIRGDLVQREPREIEEFQKGTAQIISEIGQKVESVTSGEHDAATVFPRNTHYCMAYGHRCEFLDICRSDLSRFKGVPPGYVVEDIPRDVSDYVEDILGVVS